MNGFQVDGPSPGEAELHDLLVRALDAAWAMVKQGTLPDPEERRPLEPIVETAVEAEDFPVLQAAIQGYAAGVDRLQGHLRELLKQVEEARVRRVRKWLYTEAWLSRQQQRLQEAFWSDPRRGVARWRQLVVETLLAGELELCAELAREPLPFPPQASHLPGLVEEGLQALPEAGDEALEMLQALIEPVGEGEVAPPDPTKRALMLILEGRVYRKRSNLFQDEEEEEDEPAVPLPPSALEQARARFEAARDLIPGDGRPLAALGDAALTAADLAEAARLYRQAIDLSPHEPDGFVGMGVWSERQRLWDEACDWYNKAIQALRAQPQVRDLVRALDRPLAPASGNAYLELARVLRREEDLRGALAAVDRALEAGILHDGSNPERLGHRLRGEILDGLERPLEAAAAFQQAGEGFSLRNESSVAIELFRRARELDPASVPICWDLADALRMSSWRPEPPHIDPEPIRQAHEVWEAGALMKLPDASDGWAYTLRALINEQLSKGAGPREWEIIWEAVVYLERAVLLRPSDAYAWGYLGRFYHQLNNFATALHASDRATNLAPDVETLMELRVAILSDMGRFSDATSLLDRLSLGRPGESRPWAESMRAFILMHQDNYQEAVKVLDRVLAVEPDLWYFDYRAFCYQMLGEPERAAADYRVVWAGREHPVYSSMKGYRLKAALAGLHLGEVPEAARIFGGMRDDPVMGRFGCLGLGLCHLALGHLDGAAAEIERGIAQSRSAIEIDDFCEELDWVETVVAARTDGQSLKAALDRIGRAVAARKAELARPSSSEDELRAIVARCQRDQQIGGWPWIGVRAALARLAIERGRREEAAEIYRQLPAEAERLRGASERLPRFPEAEARLGLEGALSRPVTEQGQNGRSIA